jgi:hypothetical protein
MLHMTPEWLPSVRVLASCRSALLQRGFGGLHRAPALRALLAQLHVLLGKQYSYERRLVASGEHLTHSSHLRSLVALALSLGLDNVLCYASVPLNHEDYGQLGEQSHGPDTAVSGHFWPCSYPSQIWAILYNTLICISNL